MTVAIQPSNHTGAGALALFADDPQERRRMFMNLIQRDINEDQLRLLFGICDRYGFDPMLKHVILIQKGMYVTRDGMRAYAHQTGELDGISEIEKRRNGDKWEVTVAVYRKGYAHPFIATAIQEEHENTASAPWKKSPYRMTSKCAELAALRMAFPVSLSGAEEVGYDGVSSRTNIGTVIEIGDGEAVVEDHPAPAALPAPTPLKVEDWPDDRLLAVFGQGKAEPQERRAATVYLGRGSDKETLGERYKALRAVGLDKAIADELTLARGDELGIPRKQPKPAPPADDLTAVVGEPEGDPKAKLIRLAFETGATRGWDEARVRKFGAQLYQSDNMERWSISQLDTFVAWLRDEKHDQAAG